MRITIDPAGRAGRWIQAHGAATIPLMLAGIIFAGFATWYGLCVLQLVVPRWRALALPGTSRPASRVGRIVCAGVFLNVFGFMLFHAAFPESLVFGARPVVVATLPLLTWIWARFAFEIAHRSRGVVAVGPAADAHPPADESAR